MNRKDLENWEIDVLIYNVRTDQWFKETAIVAGTTIDKTTSGDQKVDIDYVYINDTWHVVHGVEEEVSSRDTIVVFDMDIIEEYVKNGVLSSQLFTESVIGWLSNFISPERIQEIKKLLLSLEENKEILARKRFIENTNGLVSSLNHEKKKSGYTVTQAQHSCHSCDFRKECALCEGWHICKYYSYEGKDEK